MVFTQNPLPDTFLRVSLRLNNAVTVVDPIPRSDRIDNTDSPAFNFCATLSPTADYANLLPSQLTVQVQVLDADYLSDDDLGSVYLPSTFAGRTSRSIGMSTAVPSPTCAANAPCLDLSVALLVPPRRHRRTPGSPTAAAVTTTAIAAAAPTSPSLATSTVVALAVSHRAVTRTPSAALISTPVASAFAVAAAAPIRSTSTICSEM